jgi:hypothetical protein
MIRSVALVFLVVAPMTTGISAQRPTPGVAGKWEVSITGQPARLLDLTVDGTAVVGTLTKDRSEPLKVAGELKGNNLGFKTTEIEVEEEFFTLIPDGSGFHGTYSYCNKDKTTCFKTGVKLKRREL